MIAASRGRGGVRPVYASALRRTGTGLTITTAMILIWRDVELATTGAAATAITCWLITAACVLLVVIGARHPR